MKQYCVILKVRAKVINLFNEVVYFAKDLVYENDVGIILQRSY